jgi:hypothetical protein
LIKKTEEKSAMNPHQVKWIDKLETYSFHIMNIWSNIQFIIINKISMEGCTLFVTIHLKLQKLKTKILPLGGINIMCIRDFLQFPPINDTPLYSTNIQLMFTFTKLTY